MSKINYIDLTFSDALIRFFNFVTFDDIDTNWDPTWHDHISYEFHFSFGATVDYQFSDRQITLSPGEMLIIPPSVRHVSVLTKFPKKDFVTIAVDIKKLSSGDDFYENFAFALKENSLRPINIPENLKESLFVLENHELYETLLGICRLKTAASQVVFSLFKKIMQDKPVKCKTANRDVLIDSMIYSKEVTLDKIALATNYSKRQISRIIKEQYGITFSQIRRQMALNENKK